ncbi:MAG TPA: PAS domain-containing protein, partial [bacterium]|nr:PAS domain-containing protein [bacterium]
MHSQEELLAGVLNASADGAMACQAVRDAQGRIQDFRCLLANAAAERLLGLAGAALVGQSILPHLPRLEGQDLRQALARVVESGAPLEQEQSHTENGVLRWTQLRVTKFQDGVVVFLADHTERHNAEEVLSRGQRLLTAIVNTLPHVVYAKDAQGHFLVVNRHFLEFYGVTAEDLAHRRTMDVT